MGRLSLFLAAVALCACTSTVVQTRKRVIGPTPEIGVIDAGGGQVKYSLKGMDMVVAARRRAAFKQMGEVCGGKDKFAIVDEVERDETAASYQKEREDLDESIKSGKHFQFDRMMHIFFECQK